MKEAFRANGAPFSFCANHFAQSVGKSIGIESVAWNEEFLTAQWKQLFSEIESNLN